MTVFSATVGMSRVCLCARECVCTHIYVLPGLRNKLEDSVSQRHVEAKVQDFKFEGSLSRSSLVANSRSVWDVALKYVFLSCLWFLFLLKLEEKKQLTLGSHWQFLNFLNPLYVLSDKKKHFNLSSLFQRLTPIFCKCSRLQQVL